MINATELQDSTVAAALKAVRSNEDVLIEAPTGAGKTRMFCKLMNELEGEGKRTLVLGHFKELVRQNKRCYAEWNGEEAGRKSSIGMEGKIDQKGSPVFSTVQTAALLTDMLKGYDAVVIDEAHHATDTHLHYGPVLRALERINPGIQVIGVTATPPEMREGLDPRLEKARHIVITYEEAIEARLVDLPRHTPVDHRLTDGRTITDVVDAHRKGKTTAEMEAGIGREIRNGRPSIAQHARDCVDIYEREFLNEGRKTLLFFNSINELKAFEDEATMRGHAVDSIHSRRREKDNMVARARFERGDAKGLMAVDMLSEGLDIPDSDGLFILKDTMSKREFQQANGRGARSKGRQKERKTKMVDLGASTHLHGTIDAQAKVQSIRGNLDQQVISNVELLPGKSNRSEDLWVRLPAPKPGVPDVYATALDNQIVYATETEKGFVSFVSYKDKKEVNHLDLLKIGDAKGAAMSPERFADWVGDRLRRNEPQLCRMLAPNRQGTASRLQDIVSRDYDTNAGSIAKSVEMITMVVQPQAARGAMGRKHGMAMAMAYGRR